jgi:chromosome segregation ATPase
MHDAITLGVPVLAIFFGILLNQRGLGELKADLKGDIGRLRTDMGELKVDLKGDIHRLESKIDRLQADLHEFNRELGRHDVRLDNLESKRA